MVKSPTGNPVALTETQSGIDYLTFHRSGLFACLEELFRINHPDDWNELFANTLDDLMNPDHWTGEESALSKREIFDITFQYNSLMVLLPRLQRIFRQYKAHYDNATAQAETEKGGEQ
ncbi:MAG: hypothetical protein R3D58_13065 [Saprospiraceae bacterium]